MINQQQYATITISVSNEVFAIIKSKAKAAGIPYQTLINTLLTQYATGKITLTL